MEEAQATGVATMVVILDPGDLGKSSIFIRVSQTTFDLIYHNHVLGLRIGVLQDLTDLPWVMDLTDFLMVTLHHLVLVLRDFLVIILEEIIFAPTNQEFLAKISRNNLHCHQERAKTKVNKMARVMANLSR